MENGVKQRITAIIENKADSTYAFAKAINVRQSTISDYLNSGKTPSWAVIRGIVETYSDISLEWLLRGEGSMYTKDIPTDGDTEQTLDLKAEITRLRAEREELLQRITELNAVVNYQEKRLDKLVTLLHQEPPHFSLVAEKPQTEYSTNPNLK